MMRQKPSSAMQKTYDDCYLVCSTAVYFETQGNEAEALRSWRNALDQIYYFNAYRRPTNYVPKSETEKALQSSLRELELQCKERVDLLEALKESREEAKRESESGGAETPTPPPANTASRSESEQERVGWLGEGTVPAVSYPELSKPPLPKRPSLSLSSKTAEPLRTRSTPHVSTATKSSRAPVSLPVPPPKKSSRTPSPEKKSGMLKTLRPGNKDGRRSSSSRLANTLRSRPPAAAKAATQAWGSVSASSSRPPVLVSEHASKDARSAAAASGETSARPSLEEARRSNPTLVESSVNPLCFKHTSEDEADSESGKTKSFYTSAFGHGQASAVGKATAGPIGKTERKKPPTPPPHRYLNRPLPLREKTSDSLVASKPDFPSYRNEYPSSPVNTRKHMTVTASKPPVAGKGSRETNVAAMSASERVKASRDIRRRMVATESSSRMSSTNDSPVLEEEDTTSSGSEEHTATKKLQIKSKGLLEQTDLLPTPTSETSEASGSEASPEERAWKERVDRLMKHLPKGVDEVAAKQILNEIVVHGDEVHWDDVAGLEVAKAALKETVVYPFLRPDLFMGLREPARGMLLFGPPGTGKTMLARAVATESKSTFFAISASSLTSKYLGESEKLVRALFQLAKALAPSIIFVDEIDSLLSSRSGSSEHEATRRIKTEFLIQWSDLAKAAAGREQTEKEKEKGDASRVLVLAATNLPWAIDEAARRRFVRRQYIPLPEDHVRRLQLQTLLSHQKQSITEEELDELVMLTEGFSGSDITALAKDAAMGPLRSLGEKLLHMTMDEIRPIQFSDFRASLGNIRPSVSKQGLKEFEDWAREFGERGG